MTKIASNQLFPITKFMTAKENHYRFYSLFLVEPTTFDDIRDRMSKQNLLSKHLMKDVDGEDIIVLGITALKKEGSQF